MVHTAFSICSMFHLKRVACLCRNCGMPQNAKEVKSPWPCWCPDGLWLGTLPFPLRFPLPASLWQVGVPFGASYLPRIAANLTREHSPNQVTSPCLYSILELLSPFALVFFTTLRTENCLCDKSIENGHVYDSQAIVGFECLICRRAATPSPPSILSRPAPVGPHNLTTPDTQVTLPTFLLPAARLAPILLLATSSSILLTIFEAPFSKNITLVSRLSTTE